MKGRIIAPITESNIDEVLEQGCWTPVVRTSLGPTTSLNCMPNNSVLMVHTLKYPTRRGERHGAMEHDRAAQRSQCFGDYRCG